MHWTHCLSRLALMGPRWGRAAGLCPQGAQCLRQETSKHAFLGPAHGPTCPSTGAPSRPQSFRYQHLRENPQYLNSGLNTDCLCKCLKVPRCPGRGVGGVMLREELTGPHPHSSGSGSGRGSPSTDPRNPRTLASHSTICLYTWGTLRHAF